MMRNVNDEEILRVVNTVLEKPLSQDQAEAELPTLGIDSITFIRVVVALEEAFDIEIPDEYLLITEMNTLSKMTDVISTVLYHQNSVIGE